MIRIFFFAIISFCLVNCDSNPKANQKETKDNSKISSNDSITKRLIEEGDKRAPLPTYDRPTITLDEAGFLEEGQIEILKKKSDFILEKTYKIAFRIQADSDKPLVLNNQFITIFENGKYKIEMDGNEQHGLWQAKLFKDRPIFTFFPDDLEQKANEWEIRRIGSKSVWIGTSRFGDNPYQLMLEIE